MVELWIIVVGLCLLTATGSALIALRIQNRTSDNSRQEREAWQQAQEGRQRTWEVRQGKHILDAEKKLADQLKGARREWRDWSVQVQQDHQEWRDSVDLEKELARLPHIEHLELAQQTPSGRLQPKDWHPPLLYKADLQGRDLSYRYMERADLREAQLSATNLYMADLTGASLTGANLQQATLIGANLTGADLRGANFADANMLVVDLHNAALHGANLRGARGLTPEQLQTAIYDSTTLIDSSIDITLPRIPGVFTTPPQLLITSAPESQPAAESLEHATTHSGELATQSTPESASAPIEGSIISSSASEVSAVSAEAAVLTESSEPAGMSEKDTPPVLLAEINTDELVQSAENTEEKPEIAESVSTGSRKSNTTRKRTNKAKPAATPLPTLASKYEETSTEKLHEDLLSATAEDDESDAEELLPRKIIQWPTRAPKTGPLAGAGEQKNNDQASKKRSNSRTANFKSAADEADSQQAQAN